jgi:hypothetical protein
VEVGQAAVLDAGVGRAAPESAVLPPVGPHQPLDQLSVETTR